jgi:hypothetical protein
MNSDVWGNRAIRVNSIVLTLFRQDRKLAQEELSMSSEGAHKARRAKEAEVPLSRQDKILAIKKCQKWRDGLKKLDEIFPLLCDELQSVRQQKNHANSWLESRWECVNRQRSQPLPRWCVRLFGGKSLWCEQRIAVLTKWSAKAVQAMFGPKFDMWNKERRTSCVLRSTCRVVEVAQWERAKTNNKWLFL